MKTILFLVLFLLMVQSGFAQNLSSSAIGRSANLSSLATRQFLAGKGEESLALYQKAISKSEGEYGKTARIVGSMYYELGVRAYYLSKFNLSEHSLKKAVEINPNNEAAQIMLIHLLRFRNRLGDASVHLQEALKRHPDSASLRRDLVISMQETNPANAAQQAYFVSCLQTGMTDKIPTFHRESLGQAKALPANKNTAKEGKNASSSKDVTRREKGASQSAKSDHKLIKDDESEGKAIYEPINKANAKTAANKAAGKVKRAKGSKVRHKGIDVVPAGLVPPPPPPDSLGYPVAGQNASQKQGGLKAKAESITSAKSKAVKTEKASRMENIGTSTGGNIGANTGANTEANENTKKAADHSTSEDPDFLIEWASVKKKHAPAK